MNHNGEKIIIGMSGGVDSSVAALRLVELGYQVEGLFMKNWEEDDEPEYCSAAKDLEDAKNVCDTLGIQLHTVNFSSEYWDRVFSYFLDEYHAGRTPNPDVICNKEIKFRAFLDHAITLGADRIATGHYAGIKNENSLFMLKKAIDESKDQTYFLYMLNQYQLGHAIFPLGDLKKSAVREIANKNNLVTHDKKDSTGICFIGERKFKDFLQRFLPANPGDILSVDGQHLGRHDGLMFYTLGQRQGLGIGGRKDGSGEPWFVVDKNLKDNILVVAQGHDHPDLYHSTLEATHIHWISGTAPELPMSCNAKIRYRQQDQPCTVHISENDRLRIVFHQKQRAMTPGQSVVFYQDDLCLGGGIIDTISNDVS